MSKEDGMHIPSRQLNLQETLVRQTNTVSILQRILSNPADHWATWISEAYMYGSTARGTARNTSDVDVALVSNIRFVTVDDARSMGELLSTAFSEQLKIMDAHDVFIIHPNFIYKDWLDHPETANITHPEVIQHVKSEGIKFFSGANGPSR